MAPCGTGGFTGPLPGDPDLSTSALSAVPALGGIWVSWTYPALLTEAVAFTQLWRGVTSNFEAALELVKVSGTHYLDLIETPGTYYYWIRFTSVHGTQGPVIGPASATSLALYSQLLTALTSRISLAQLDIPLSADIAHINQIQADLLQEVTDRQGLGTTLGQAITDANNGVAQALSFLGQEVIDRQSGDSNLLATIDAQVVTLNGSIAGVNTLVVTEISDREAGDTALALSITTLESSVNGAIANVQNYATAVSDALDVVEANWGVKVQARADGKYAVAGLGLLSTIKENVAQSQMIFLADAFTFVSGAAGIDETPTPLLQLGLVNGANTLVLPATRIGDTTIASRMIVDGTIKAQHLEASSISLINAAATTATWAGLSGAPGNLLRNLVDSSGWTVGVWPPPGWTDAGSPPDGSSNVILATRWDGSVGKVHESVSGSTDDTVDGGWNAANTWIPDPTKTYRFIHFLYAVNAIDQGGVPYDASPASMYAGLAPFATVGTERVTNIGGGDQINPYFWSGHKKDMQLGRWYMSVGFVHPYGYAGAISPTSGLYDLTTGQKVAIGTAADFVWKAAPGWVSTRSFGYYSGSASDTIRLGEPIVEIVDGSELPLDSILAKGIRGRVDTAINNAGLVVSGVKPGSPVTPAGAGLYLGADYMGYYSGSAWKTYMSNAGDLYCAGINGYLQWIPNSDTLEVKGTIHATAGSIGGTTTIGGVSTTDLTSTFSASTGSSQSYNNASVPYTHVFSARTAIPSGGAAPYTYRWTLSIINWGAPTDGTMWMTGDPLTNTVGVTARVETGGVQITARATCVITDANGRTAQVTANFLASSEA